MLKAWVRCGMYDFVMMSNETYHENVNKVFMIEGSRSKEGEVELARPRSREAKAGVEAGKK
jgi:hypothetical protein